MKIIPVSPRWIIGLLNKAAWAIKSINLKIYSIFFSVNLTSNIWWNIHRSTIQTLMVISKDCVASHVMRWVQKNGICYLHRKHLQLKRKTTLTTFDLAMFNPILGWWYYLIRNYVKIVEPVWAFSLAVKISNRYCKILNDPVVSSITVPNNMWPANGESLWQFHLDVCRRL